jgi:hypothetical protein
VILQREVDQSADTFDVLPFKVSPSQVIYLKTFDFVGLSMSEVGTVVMPLSIIPPEATSLAASRALANNHAQAETYDLSGESTALSTADTQRLRNQNGYATKTATYQPIVLRHGISFDAPWLLWVPSVGMNMLYPPPGAAYSENTSVLRLVSSTSWTQRLERAWDRPSLSFTCS